MRNPDKSRYLGFKGASILSLISALSWLCTPAFSAEQLKLANTHSLLTSLVTLASDEHLYDHFGVPLQIDVKESGEAAVNSLLSGEADLAVVAAIPFVKQAMKHPNLRMIASVGQSDNQIKIVARKDHHITRPEDLRGKHIGTQPGIAYSLFLDGLLEQHGMTRQDITPVFMPAQRLPDALANGLIDAMAVQEPYPVATSGLQQDDLLIISVPGIYVKSLNLVTTNEFLQSDRANSLIPVLQALYEAERRLTSQPDKMTELLSKQFETTPEAVRRQLHEARLTLSLDSHLLASLDNVSRWLTSARGGAEEHSIDFKPYLHTPLLATVKPQGVNLLP